MLTGFGLILLITIGSCIGAQYGDRCMWSSECSGVLVCRNYQCTCSPNTRYVGQGQCADEQTGRPRQRQASMKSSVGGSCTGDSECMGSRTYCIDFACQCDFGCIWDGSLNDCRERQRPPTTTTQAPQKKSIGSSCDSSSDCLGSRTTCKDCVCQCQNGLVWNENIRDCCEMPRMTPAATKPAPVAKSFGATCAYSYECLGIHTSCRDGVCQCDNNYVWDGSINDCREKPTPQLNGKAVGSSCLVGSDCLGIHTSCVDCVCKCDSNYVWDERIRDCKQPAPTPAPTTQPVPLSKRVGASCMYSLECMGNSTICENNVCQCYPGYVWDEGILDCWQPFQRQDTTPQQPMSKTIGSSCATSFECMGFHTSCINKVCQCDIGYVWDPNIRDCWQPPFVMGKQETTTQLAPLSKPVGSACTFTYECMGLHTSCILNVCQCDLAYSWDQTQRDCTRDSSAPRTTQPAPMSKSVGSSCTSTFECPIFSSCLNSVCQCDPGYENDPILKACTIPSSSGKKRQFETCSRDIECRGALLCLNSKCNCPGRLIYDEGTDSCWR